MKTHHWAELLLLVLLCFSCQNEKGVFYVSPEGNDKAMGTQQAPWKNINHAITQIRKFVSENPGTPIKVYFEEGTYPIQEMIDLNNIQSPITFTAVPGKTVLWTGAVKVNNWKEITDEAILNRLQPEVRKKIKVANLEELGISDCGQLSTNTGRMDLYHNNKRQKMSRWPNNEYAVTGKAMGKTLFKLNSTYKVFAHKEPIWEYTDKRINQWAKEENACVNGYWYWDWAESNQSIIHMDTIKQIITLAEPIHHYGYKDNCRFYGYNLLCEIDIPGEYCIDCTHKLLYWYAPESYNPEQDEVMVSVLDSPYMLSVSDMNQFVLDGITLQGGRNTAIKISNGEANQILNCHITSFGQDAMHIDGGKKHQIQGCLLEQFGCSGIKAKGGDRKTLTPAEYLIEDNIIQNFSLFSHTYQPAILIQGVGTTIRNNQMRGSTSSAIRVEANDVLIEYNHFSDLVRESDDQGGLDMFYNYSIRGLVIRYNYWENILGGTDHGAAAIRFDDAISGEKVYGNIFVNCGSKRFGAVQIHGGKDNYVENNLFYKCHASVSFSPWTKEKWNELILAERSVKRIYEEVDINSEVYQSRYPELKDSLNAHINVNYINNNLLVGCTKDIIHKSPKEEKMDVQSILKDNVNLKSADKELAYYLQDSVLNSYGLKPIPYSKIGPQENRYKKFVHSK